MSLKKIAVSTYGNCISSTEVHVWSRLSSRAAEAALIPKMISAAELYAEHYMSRGIMKQGWRMVLDAIPIDDEIDLPMSPLSTPATENVTFTYVDSSGDIQAMPATCYEIDDNSTPNRILKAHDSEWPSNIRDHKNSIVIDYSVGVTSATAVPETIKTWCSFRVGSMYENRESLMVGSNNFIEELPHSYVDGLLDEFVVIKVG